MHGALLVFNENPGKTTFPSYVLLFCFRLLFWFMLFLSFPFFMFVYMWDSGVYVFLTFGIQFVSIFLLWNSCFHFLSLYFPWSLDHARLSPWAQGPAEVFTHVHTKTLADHPQF